jgi:Flp pilus assembly pilin Flp
MKKVIWSAWSEEDGVLSFEWVLLVSLLVIGIVTGLSAARDAIIDELGDAAQAMLAVDQSYTIDHPLNNDVHTNDPTAASDSSFTDAAVFVDCGRTSNVGQSPQDISDDPA